MSNFIEEIYHTMRHARTFITSRERMHPDGVRLYDEMLGKIEDIVTKPKPQQEGGDNRTETITS